MANEENKRTSIPPAVKYILREEVGFGCPVEGCASPYLEYHHFDPPVHIKAHNDPGGMIALCPTHHGLADGGNYTNEQLHLLKKNKANAEKIKGNLGWLRNNLLAVVGGNYYFETPRVVTIDNQDVVALYRDGNGYLRLTVNMLSILPEVRLTIESHSWERVGNPVELRCPPQGKELEVKYQNGDYLNLRFLVLEDVNQTEKRYKDKMLERLKEHFPLTVVEVNMKIGGTNIEFSPGGTNFGGVKMAGNIFMRSGGGIIISNSGIKWRQNEKLNNLYAAEQLNYGQKFRSKSVLIFKLSQNI